MTKKVDSSRLDLGDFELAGSKKETPSSSISEESNSESDNRDESKESKGRGRPKGSKNSKDSSGGAPKSKKDLAEAASDKYGKENKRDKEYTGKLQDFMFFADEKETGNHVSVKLDKKHHEALLKVLATVDKGKLNHLIFHIIEDFTTRNKDNMRDRIKKYFDL